MAIINYSCKGTEDYSQLHNFFSFFFTSQSIFKKALYRPTSLITRVTSKFQDEPAMVFGDVSEK